MNESHGAHALGLLQFEVGRQVFAIAVGDLAGVEQRHDLAPAEFDLAGTDQRSTHAPLIDVGELFFGHSHIMEGGSVLVAKTATHLAALLVDRVLPGTVVPGIQRHPLPAALAPFALPFSGLFFKPDQWVLIVDTARLLDMIGARSPSALVEVAREHAQ